MGASSRCLRLAGDYVAAARGRAVGADRSGHTPESSGHREGLHRSRWKDQSLQRPTGFSLGGQAGGGRRGSRELRGRLGKGCGWREEGDVPSAQRQAVPWKRKPEGTHFGSAWRAEFHVTDRVSARLCPPQWPGTAAPAGKQGRPCLFLKSISF